MKMKFLYNTLLTIGIVLMFLSALSAYRSEQYWITAASVAIMLILFFLKFRLLKEIRESARKK